MFIGWLSLATAKIDEWPADPRDKEPTAPDAARAPKSGAQPGQKPDPSDRVLSEG